MSLRRTLGATLQMISVTESDSSQEKSLFENRFAYAIALLLHGNQADTPTEVALTKVTATQLSGRNILRTCIHKIKTTIFFKIRWAYWSSKIKKR